MKKTFIIVFALLVATTVLVLGFYLGQRKGIQTEKKEVTEKLQPLVDLAFPKPPEDIRNFAGKILAIYGATINLEIDAPDDYLPHTDGTKRQKEIRFASVTNDTKVIRIDATKLDAQGNQIKTNIKFSDLKIGDAITVRSNTNIRAAKKFDVTQIEMVKY